MNKAIRRHPVIHSSNINSFESTASAFVLMLIRKLFIRQMNLLLYLVLHVLLPSVYEFAWNACNDRKLFFLGYSDKSLYLHASSNSYYLKGYSVSIDHLWLGPPVAFFIVLIWFLCLSLCCLDQTFDWFGHSWYGQMVQTKQQKARKWTKQTIILGKPVENEKEVLVYTPKETKR